MFEQFLRRHSFFLAIALTALGTARIAATYRVFNHTVDEPAHIACGLEWWSDRTYEYEPQHPPLARLMATALPYFAGARSHDEEEMVQEGLAILYDGGHYQRTLTLARMGILPFFWLGSLVTFFWTRRSFGELAALVATFLFTFTPPILAHSGLATTDMALAATFAAAFLAMLLWLENPSGKRTAIFGIALAATVLSKFSALVFFPASAAIAAIFYWIATRISLRQAAAMLRPRLAPLAGAILIACLVIWAGYRFSFDKIPAPELPEGIHDLREHNRTGHDSYLLGKTSPDGFWYYYPVVLAVKTPLPLAALAAVGVWVCWKRRAALAYWMPGAFALGVLAVAAFSRINIGVRHVLPVYIAFAILGGIGAAALMNSGTRARPILPWICAALLLWMLATSALSHPDYLAYFNALAGREPEKIAVDSDLDWGQDMLRLSARLRQLGATHVAFDPFVPARLEAAHGFPPIQPLDPNRPIPGWNAVSLTRLKLYHVGAWADHTRPTERVGKSILLFYAPPDR